MVGKSLALGLALYGASMCNSGGVDIVWISSHTPDCENLTTRSYPNFGSVSCTQQVTCKQLSIGIPTSTTTTAVHRTFATAYGFACRVGTTHYEAATEATIGTSHYTELSNIGQITGTGSATIQTRDVLSTCFAAPVVITNVPYAVGHCRTS